MRNALITFRDLVQHTLDFLGANVTNEARRDSRRAAENALRELASAHRWSYYYTRGRLNTVAPYSTGTLEVAAATGVVTLTGGAWPSWANYGVLQINSVLYQIASVTSATVLTLSRQTAPAAAVVAGTGYTLWRDTFPLPTDCLSISRMILVNNAFALSYEHPDLWLQRQRVYRGPASPRTYTIRGEPHYLGALAVSFFPAPDNVYPVDYLYQRTPRALRIEEYSTGTVTSVIGEYTLAGTGTAFNANHVGSVIRLSTDTVNLPDPITGSYPAAQERIILEVTNATTVVVDLPWTVASSGVKYLISDPVDIEPASMANALYRCCERQAGMSRSRKDRNVLDIAYKEALILAREADARNFASESSGGTPAYPYRMADMPRGADVS